MSVAKFALAVMLAATAAPLTTAAQSRTPKPNPTPTPNERPSVKLAPSADRVTLAGCGEGEPAGPLCLATSPKVKLSARATDPDGDTLLYTYTTTGGRVEGEGPEVTLDLTGVAPGVYTVTVKVDDGNGGVATDSAEVTVERCTCDPPPTPPCPTVTVSCRDTAVGGEPLTFIVSVSGGDPNVTPTYNWTVPGRVITSGQGTDSITVEAPSDGSAVTATVEVLGYDRGCVNAASCATSIFREAPQRKIDEYGDIARGDEKARLDNFFIELQNDPTARGYLVCYGGRAGGKREGRRRCRRARDYLVNARGVSADRVVVVDGGLKEELTVELWAAASGAGPPSANPTVDPSEIRAPPRRRTSRQRRHLSPRRRGRR